MNIFIAFLEWKQMFLNKNIYIYIYVFDLSIYKPSIYL